MKKDEAKKRKVNRHKEFVESIRVEDAGTDNRKEDEEFWLELDKLMGNLFGAEDS